MMYHIPAVLTPQEVDDFTAQLQQAEWVDGRVTTGDQGAQVKNNQQVDTRSNLYAELQGNVLAALNRSSLFCRRAAEGDFQPAVQPLPAERNLRFPRRRRGAQPGAGRLDAHRSFRHPVFKRSGKLRRR